MVEIKPKEYWPIVYRTEYNVTFFGLENLHPFDSKKWAHIYKVSKRNSISNSINISLDLILNPVLFLLFLIFKIRRYNNKLLNG